MIDRKELEQLAARMRLRGALVTVTNDRDGHVAQIRISGAKGIGPFPMSPLSAAERMREFLFKDRPVVSVHAMTPAMCESIAVDLFR